MLDASFLAGADTDAPSNATKITVLVVLDDADASNMAVFTFSNVGELTPILPHNQYLQFTISNVANTPLNRLTL